MSVSNHSFEAVLKIAALGLVRQDLELARSVDTSGTVVSVKTLRKVRRDIRKFERGLRWREVPSVLRRVVAAILIVCTISFGVCMSVQPIRAEFVKMIMEWYDKFVAIFYVVEDTPPSSIEEYREPQLQLAGTERVEVLKGDIINQIFYMKDSEIVYTYEQTVKLKAASNIDTENCIIEEISINNYLGNTFLYQDGRIAIIWSDDEYAYIISSFIPNINPYVLTSIAESVK